MAENCRGCDGEGKVKVYKVVENCRGCDGEGKVKIYEVHQYGRDFTGDYAKCSFCDGTGDGTVSPEGVERFIPIQLSEYGEELLDYPVDNALWALKRSRFPGWEEKYELLCSNCIGVHRVCHSFVDIKAVSESYMAICCRGCNMRIMVPVGIKTMADLRRWSEDKF